MTIDGHRQHEAVVVVGMLANQIDAPWRYGKSRPAAAAECLLELLKGSLKETGTGHGSRLRAQGSGLRDSGKQKRGKPRRPSPFDFLPEP